MTETPSMHSEDLSDSDRDDPVSLPDLDDGDTRDPGSCEPMDASDLSPLEVSGPNDDTRDAGDAESAPPDYR